MQLAIFFASLPTGISHSVLPISGREVGAKAVEIVLFLSAFLLVTVLRRPTLWRRRSGTSFALPEGSAAKIGHADSAKIARMANARAPACGILWAMNPADRGRIAVVSDNRRRHPCLHENEPRAAPASLAMP